MVSGCTDPAATQATGWSIISLDRHLARHPEDAVYRPILVGVFAALEQAHLLGSVLRPEEHLDAAIADFRKQGGRGEQLGLLGESTAANRLLEELGKHDPAELKRLQLERVGRSFARRPFDTAHGEATPDETAITVGTERIRELDEFAARLRQVEEQGFARPALDDLLAAEPLDRANGAPTTTTTITGHNHPRSGMH